MSADALAGPMRKRALFGWLVLVAIWVAGTYALAEDSRELPVWGAFLVSFIWVGAGAAAGTLLFVELVRKVYFHQGLDQPRTAPRLRAVTTGIVERALFTILAIVLLREDVDSGGAMLAALSAGYVGLKGFKRDEVTEKQVWVSLHSIWGSGVSIAFAVFAGWLFWHFRGI